MFDQDRGGKRKRKLKNDDLNYWPLAKLHHAVAEVSVLCWSYPLWCRRCLVLPTGSELQWLPSVHWGWCPRRTPYHWNVLSRLSEWRKKKKKRAVSSHKKLWVIHSSFFIFLSPHNTCHGISPGITTSPPTMRRRGRNGTSASLCIHQDIFTAGGDVVGPAGVVGRDAMLFSRLEFSRVLVIAGLTAVRAVLPHGNSAGVVK